MNHLTKALLVKVLGDTTNLVPLLHALATHFDDQTFITLIDPLIEKLEQKIKELERKEQ